MGMHVSINQINHSFLLNRMDVGSTIAKQDIYTMGLTA